MQRQGVIAQLLGLQCAFFAAWGLCLWSLMHLGPGGLRNALVMMPVLPGLLIIAWAVWMYRRCDEFIRARTLRAGAVTAMVIAAGSLIYAYLELLGLPRLSMGWVSNVGWVVFDAQMLRLIFQR
jgi:hypothetical protein